MSEIETSRQAKSKLWRAGLPKDAVPKHELDFIMLLSRLDRTEALALLRKHGWDREALFSELHSQIRSA